MQGHHKAWSYSLCWSATNAMSTIKLYDVLALSCIFLETSRYQNLMRLRLRIGEAHKSEPEPRIHCMCNMWRSEVSIHWESHHPCSCLLNLAVVSCWHANNMTRWQAAILNASLLSSSLPIFHHVFLLFLASFLTIFHFFICKTANEDQFRHLRRCSSEALPYQRLVTPRKTRKFNHPKSLYSLCSLGSGTTNIQRELYVEHVQVTYRIES